MLLSWNLLAVNVLFLQGLVKHFLSVAIKTRDSNGKSLNENVSIKTPQIDESAFIADGAKVIGDVIMKPESSAGIS